MQNNPTWKSNSSSATQENTNRPIIWTHRTRYCVHRILQLVLILSQINLLHAFPTYLRYIHFYAGICHVVYAQPLILFTKTMFDADISETCKAIVKCLCMYHIFQSPSTISYLWIQFHKMNDYDCPAIFWVYRTLTAVPDSRTGFSASGAADENQ